ncbi:MAG TPA: hypothetical protein V6D18_11670 [Thermosynechococcaceae cyanobacterium]
MLKFLNLKNTEKFPSLSLIEIGIQYLSSQSGVGNQEHWAKLDRV